MAHFRPAGLAILAVTLLYLAQSTAVTPSDPFDVQEATIESIHNALFTRFTTCRDVVSSFIARIEEFNPTINAIIALNPEALSIADELDARISTGNITGPLFCIPVLLKDNYDTVGMATTGGCRGLAGNMPGADAPSVVALKNAGAIILGKTNLHELALEGLSVSSLGGQTINPYDHTRTPGGSSGGTSAAIAASFAVLGTGTDTVNSMRSPASANSLFSFRPTRGLISRSGVIPVSYTQDALGPMARTLDDLAVALAVMAGVGYDSADNATALAPPEVRARYRDHPTSLFSPQLEDMRFGLLDGFFNHTASPETTPVNEVMGNIVSRLTAAGATVVNISEAIFNAPAISATLDVQTYEYREFLDAYLARPNASGTHRPASFNELYTSGNFLVIPSQHTYIKTAFRSSSGDASYFTAQRGIQHLTEALAATFASNDLDAIIYPEQKNLVVKLGSASQSGRNGILAALTGSPVVTIPAGFSAPTIDAPLGVPIGMEILGQPWSEDLLLDIARHISELVPVRRMPKFSSKMVEPRAYESVPVIRPNMDNIPSAYPLGVV
ncbi:amidase signature domain-containing protein [Podospora appendiculata]|uniref:Amidase signature domain-containing protein n=1 Tax=Podospora appendiculata TaxID=314037 RepID=A0AAE1CGI1_9PEZI|nr:amidase signature domain-containing protein [Podospora appendiculata]